MRTCVMCNRALPDKFFRRTRGAGRMPWCKVCGRTKSRRNMPLCGMPEFDPAWTHDTVLAWMTLYLRLLDFQIPAADTGA